METTLRARPSRAEIEPAALDLIRRHSGQIMSTARRHSATPEDAEDAYQRGIEILLTKAPSTSEDDLLPWLKTVVKHEAYAVRRQRLRTPPVSAICDGEEEREPLAPGSADEEAERYDRLRLGAEAMGRLKPQEVRALLLKAEGLTYKEIQEETGWTYTKVNRCITEGRRAFVARVQGIESGAECERLAPLLSALADGEATAEDMAALRPHLRGCLSCRATLREYREVPARAAALVPAAALVGGGGGLGGGGVLGWLHAHAAHTALRAHGVLEAVSGSKAAAVAGATAALAGGGVAAVHELGPAPHGHPRRGVVRRHVPAARPAPVVRMAAPSKPRHLRPAAVARPSAATAPARPAPRPSSPAPAPPAPPAMKDPPRRGGQTGEFAP
jgi:RNA polymerase sigma factor (sigma-70 family)